MEALKGWKPYTPPEGTVPTLIHDIYGDGILVYFPKGDRESPRRVERAIRQAQLNPKQQRGRMRGLNKGRME